MTDRIVSEPLASVLASITVGSMAAFVKSMTGVSKTRAVHVATGVYKEHETEVATPEGYMEMVEEAMMKAVLTDDANS